MNAWPTLQQWLEFAGILSLELLLLFAVAKLISRRLHSAQHQRCLWQIVMTSMLLVFAGELCGARQMLRLPKSPAKNVIAASPTRTVVVTLKDPESLASSTVLPFETSTGETLPSTAPISIGQKRTRWPAAAWLGISLLFLVRIVLGQMLSLVFRVASRRCVDPGLETRAARLARLLDIRRPLRIAISAKAAAPFTFGVWRPVIVLPAHFTETYSPEQQDAALAHELAHVAGADSAWRALSNFTCALLWWNPWVWLARRELDHASELGADESSLLLEDGPSALAECLVNCARRIRTPTAFSWLGMDGGGYRSSLGRRVSRLLHLNPRAPAAIGVPWYLRIILPLFCVLGLWLAMGFTARRSVAPSKNPWQASLMASALAALAEPAKGNSSAAKRIEGLEQQQQPGEKAATSAGQVKLSPQEQRDPIEARRLAFKNAVGEDNVGLEVAEPARQAGAAEAAENESGLRTRFFKVDPNTLSRSLRSMMGGASNNSETNYVIKNPRLEDSPPNQRREGLLTEVIPAETVVPELRSFLSKAGVDLSGPGKAIFYNDRRGIVMVRATLEELEAIENAMQMFNLGPPQLVIQVKVMEVPVNTASNALLGFGLTNTSRTADTFSDPSLLSVTSGRRSAAVNATNRPAPTLTGILTDEQFRNLVAGMEKIGGTDLLSAPTITTISGRQAQIKVVDVRYVVTDIDYSTNGLPAGSAAIGQPIAEPFEIGPVVDIVPFVEADGYTIQMTVLPTLREFLGYDEDPLQRRTDLPATGGPLAPEPRQPTPLPKFRIRQVASTARVWDGQTLVLGAGRARLSEMVSQPNGSITTNQVDKELFFFITPRLIDPAGNRLHSDDELGHRQGVPEQPKRAPRNDYE